MRSRFQIYFPFISRVIDAPFLFASVLVFFAIPLAGLSLHYFASLFCCAVSICIISTQKRFTNYILLTPVNIIAFYLALGPGLGVALVAHANGGELAYGLFLHQWVSIATAIISICCINFATRDLKIIHLPLKDPRFFKDILRPLLYLGWILLSLSLMQMIVGAVTGSADRGFYGEEASLEFFGPWTIFAIFPRITVASFFLFPLILLRSTFFGKMVAGLIFVAYFLFAFASGSRGAIIFPLVYMACGFYFFSSIRAIKMDVLALLAILLLAPLFVLINDYRTSVAFQETRLIDLWERLSSLGDRNELDHLKFKSRGTEVLGGRLVTVHDFLVYEKTPRYFPHVGAQGLEHFYWVWIPYFFAQNRPIQQDAYSIALQYREVKYNPRSRNRVSLNADLYRRFSWPGIILGNFAFFAFFGYFYKKVLVLALTRNALLGILLLIYTFSYLTRGPTSTVMETWWQWAYEFPKHLVLILLIYYIFRTLFKLKPQGLMEYKYR